MKSLAKFAYVLMTMAVGAVSWADEADLAHWRMTVATNGYASVERKVKVPQDVQQTIWKCYREHIGIEGVQMSKPRLVATNECGAVYDLPFTTADGARHNFGVVLSEGTARPLYRVGRGLADSAKLAELNPAEYVSGMFLADSKGGSRIASPGRVLSSLDAKVVLGFSNDAVLVPFDEYLFYFIDDCPLANWGHPARCVFVKPDLSEFVVLHVDMPARVLVGGRDVELSPVGGDVAMEESFSAAAGTRSSAMLMGSGAKSAFPAVTDGDPANCYALLVSGGGDAANNHGRYWNDMCFAYNVLRQRYGLPRQNIKVLWAKGNPNADLCWTSGKCCWKTCLGKNAFPTDDCRTLTKTGTTTLAGRRP